MLFKVLTFFLFFDLATSSSSFFIFNGFYNSTSSIILDGDALFTPAANSLLLLTNATKYLKSHAFYSTPFKFKKTAAAGSSTFSTTFVFSLITEVPDVGGNGFAFVLSPTKNFSHALSNQFLGLFNTTSNGKSDNHVFAVEFDTVENPELFDINDNHVGVDINGLVSVKSTTTGYYHNEDAQFEVLSLISGKPIQAWVDYNSEEARLDVSVSPFKFPKPDKSLLSININLSSLMFEDMYIGFSASTGFTSNYHYILGWSFQLGNGGAPALNLDFLPLPPKLGKDSGKPLKTISIWLPLVAVFAIVAGIGGIVRIMGRKKQFAEVLDEWELDFIPQRISYKDLFKATKGFKQEAVVGAGGFGRVYRGLLPKSKIEVAVKKISHDSNQGEKEFISEIASLGKLRHRNIVQLLGYCRRRGELLLVYDFMHNGSLDKFLFSEKYSLPWERRFQIIKGVAAGLLYLHEDNERLVIHRDVKASNVLLDRELNGKLGDFGMARLYDHGSVPYTTHVVGTMGYLAPELSRTGKATTASDVFAFGAFLLEVACGRRPIENGKPPEEVELVAWVLDRWRRCTVLATADRKLGSVYPVEEMELALKLGLLCSHPHASARPGIRQVVQYLDGDAALPELVIDDWNEGGRLPVLDESSGDHVASYSVPTTATVSTILSEGR